ncbi:hypothetical protein M885DRAFT_91777 [Pelagophyceae sp. CCMP2097]|nr:hypothetical protein M885DRAFT_91777 [Pelagophyceae sp. CCMP2097]
MFSKAVNASGLLESRVEQAADRISTDGAESGAGDASARAVANRLARKRDDGLTPEQRDWENAKPKGPAQLRDDDQHARTSKAVADENDDEALNWKWIAINAEGKMLETARRDVALFRSRVAAAKWAARVCPSEFTVSELARGARGAFERDVRSQRVQGDADDELAAALEDDPVWVEFRRQAARTREGGTDADARAALAALRDAEDELSKLESEADEARCEADMHELALVEMFSRCQHAEAANADHAAALRASPHGEALREGCRRLAELRHPAAAPDADPARLAAAAAALLATAPDDAVWEQPPPAARRDEPARHEPAPPLDREDRRPRAPSNEWQMRETASVRRMRLFDAAPSHARGGGPQTIGLW